LLQQLKLHVIYVHVFIMNYQFTRM
jgi:hypothetical protein